MPAPPGTRPRVGGRDHCRAVAGSSTPGYALIRFLSVGAPLLTGLLLILPGPTPLQAQGFGVFEQSACALARAGASVARPCDDGSAHYFNPAALADLPAPTLGFGAAMILADGTFTDDYLGTRTELDSEDTAVPHAFFGMRLSDRISAGAGVYIPYALVSRWPRTFDGAFEGYGSKIETTYLQPTFAIDITPRLAVGGGPVWAMGWMELSRFLDLSLQPLPSGIVPPGSLEISTFGELGVPYRTPFADMKIRSERASGWGGHLGIRYRVRDGLDVGARYLTAIRLEYQATAEFERVPTGLRLPATIPIGSSALPAGLQVDALILGQFQEGRLLGTQGVETEMTMPSRLTVGVAWEPSETLLLLMDWERTGWSSFDEIPFRFEALQDQVRTEDFGDTHAFRAGAEYGIAEGWRLRAGWGVNDAAAPDASVSPLFPEGTRNRLTAGVGWSHGDRMGLDVAWQLLLQDDRRGRTRAGPPVGGSAEVQPPSPDHGLYTFRGRSIAATFTFRY